MSVIVKCDSCDFSADIDADDCPDRMEVLWGGDPLDGGGAELHQIWHACARCREAFIKHVPASVRGGEDERV